MTTVRSAKSKGSQFELSVRDSLAQKYGTNVLLTKQEGVTYKLQVRTFQDTFGTSFIKHKGQKKEAEKNGLC